MWFYLNTQIIVGNSLIRKNTTFVMMIRSAQGGCLFCPAVWDGALTLPGEGVKHACVPRLLMQMPVGGNVSSVTWIVNGSHPGYFEPFAMKLYSSDEGRFWSWSYFRDSWLHVPCHISGLSVNRQNLLRWSCTTIRPIFHNTGVSVQMDLKTTLKLGPDEIQYPPITENFDTAQIRV